MVLSWSRKTSRSSYSEGQRTLIGIPLYTVKRLGTRAQNLALLLPVFVSAKRWLLGWGEY